MKRVLSALAAISMILAAMPAAASENDLLTIGRELGVIPYGCSYGNTVNRGACLTREAARIIERHKHDDVRAAEADRRRAENMAIAADELKTACSAGDRWSCQRVRKLQAANGGNSLPILRALSAACRAGDKPSCQRLRQYTGHS